MILLPLNCNCSQVLQMSFAGSFVRHSLLMWTKETEKSWGACECCQKKYRLLLKKETLDSYSKRVDLSRRGEVSLRLMQEGFQGHLEKTGACGHTALR